MKIRISLSAIILASLMLFCVHDVTAAQKKKQKDKKEPLDTRYVEDSINRLKKDIKAELEKKKKITPLTLVMYGNRFIRFSKHPDIEKETRIYKGWYSNLGKICTAMGNLKTNYLDAVYNKDADIIKQCATDYRKLREKCKKLLDNPAEIKSKKKPRRRH